jgi:hypothetical protein
METILNLDVSVIPKTAHIRSMNLVYPSDEKNELISISILALSWILLVIETRT